MHWMIKATISYIGGYGMGFLFGMFTNAVKQWKKANQESDRLDLFISVGSLEDAKSLSDTDRVVSTTLWAWAPTALVGMHFLLPLLLRLSPTLPQDKWICILAHNLYKYFLFTNSKVEMRDLEYGRSKYSTKQTIQVIIHYSACAQLAKCKPLLANEYLINRTLSLYSWFKTLLYINFSLARSIYIRFY